METEDWRERKRREELFPPEIYDGAVWDKPAQVAPVSAQVAPKPKFTGPSTTHAWLARELPQPDYLMGGVFSTTTKTMLAAGTGAGKTLFSLPLANAMAAGQDFLHWRAHRPCRVIFLDGEMPRDLMRDRIAEAIEQTDTQPEGLSVVSHEDIENFPPLNTPEGQALMDSLIADLGGADFIVCDNVMALLDGDPKDTQPWREVLPWVNSLTKRRIGQLWIHHAGHDGSRFYGDSTRSWRMESVIHLTAVENTDADVCVDLEFKKARNRTPAVADDFGQGRVTLRDRQWHWQPVKAASREARVSPKGLTFLDALTNALAGFSAPYMNRPSVTMDQWKAECIRMGLIDAEGNSARALFSKHRIELVTAHRIACDGKMVWKTQLDG